MKADCSSNGISVFPTKSTITRNSIFVINGCGMSQELIKGLGKKYKVYLSNGDEKIYLELQNLYVGQYSISQAVLKPAKNLTLGTEYVLVIDDLPKYEHFKKYNPEKQEYEPYSFKVSANADDIKPRFTGDIKELKKTLIYYGCGPSEHVVFNCPVSEASEYLIKATVKNLKTGAITSYLIESVNNKVKIGHGMCSGAFTFSKSDEYEVTFGVIDASGNYTAASRKPIKFSKPTRDNSKNKED